MTERDMSTARCPCGDLIVEHVCPNAVTIISAAAAARREQIEIMNSRCATDAKSYERDQYLIKRLREQLAETSDLLDASRSEER